MKKALFIHLVFSFFCITLFGQTRVAEKEFYDSSTVREIRINFEQDNWNDLLDSMRLYGDEMLLAKIKIDEEEFENAGVRYRKSRSFSVGKKRNPFHIELDFVDRGQNYQGFKTVILSTALRDPSMVREVMGFEIARKYMYAPRANYARLYINDKYYGLMINVQAVDEVFLEQNFGSFENTFVKSDPPKDEKVPQGCRSDVYASLQKDNTLSCLMNNFELLSDHGWRELYELTERLADDSESINEVINVDRVLWMHAFNNMLVNLSSYSGQYSPNYFLYKDEFGKFNPIVYDLNLSFGSYKNIGQGSDLDLKELQQLDPLLHADNPSRPLISKLLANEKYRKIYISHLKTILYEVFESGWYEKRAKELQRLITVPFYNDQNKDYTSGEFNRSLTETIGTKSKIPGIVELMSKRIKFLKKHPEILVLPPNVVDLNVYSREQYGLKNIDQFKITAKVDRLPNRVWLFYRFSPDAPYMEVAMMDDGKHNDGEEGDYVFGAIIDPKGKSSSIEYYIFSENSKSVDFDPPNYMFSPHKSDLKELNE